jgi:hypothetical protein
MRISDFKNQKQDNTASNDLITKIKKALIDALKNCSSKYVFIIK